MPLLRSRDALLAGVLETMLIMSWVWDRKLHVASAMNLCVILSVIAIPSAIFDYIMQHAPRNKAGLRWSVWEAVASARQAAVILVYFHHSAVLPCASAATCLYVLYVLVTGRRASAAETARLAQRTVYQSFCVAMVVVLFLQRQALLVAVPLAVCYVPRNNEAWMRVVTGTWLLYLHCALVASQKLA